MTLAPKAVQAEPALRLEVSDGRQEGLLTLRGVLAELDQQPERLVVFDVGGGSTEYTLARQGEPLFTRSLPLGVVRLTEGKGTPAAMIEKIDRELAPLRFAIEEADRAAYLDGATTLVGTAGTATTLAAISLQLADYDYRKINNCRLPLAEVERRLAGNQRALAGTVARREAEEARRKDAERSRLSEEKRLRARARGHDAAMASVPVPPAPDADEE